MKAVFLDRATFSPNLDLTAPSKVSSYQVYDNTLQDDDLIVARCYDAQIIITNKVKFSATLIRRLPNLKLIQLTATGMNNVDQLACQDQQICLQNVAGYASKSVPEHTLMLILMAMRAGGSYHQRAIDGTWQQDGRFCLLDTPLLDLEGRTLGVIGVGTIGKKVSQLAKAFGMQVLWAERSGRMPRNDDYTDFDEVLAKSDIISLHCPLTDDNRHLINASTLQKMVRRPLLVNVARGDLVDGQAVANAVIQGQILGYASDVFAQEPFAVDDPLLAIAHHPRVVFTPHNAWGSLNAQSRLWEILCENVNRFIVTQRSI